MRALPSAAKVCKALDSCKVNRAGPSLSLMIGEGAVKLEAAYF